MSPWSWRAVERSEREMRERRRDGEKKLAGEGVAKGTISHTIKLRKDSCRGMPAVLSLFKSPGRTCDRCWTAARREEDESRLRTATLTQRRTKTAPILQCIHFRSGCRLSCSSGCTRCSGCPRRHSRDDRRRARSVKKYSKKVQFRRFGATGGPPKKPTTYHAVSVCQAVADAVRAAVLVVANLGARLLLNATAVHAAHALEKFKRKGCYTGKIRKLVHGVQLAKGHNISGTLTMALQRTQSPSCKVRPAYAGKKRG